VDGRFVLLVGGDRVSLGRLGGSFQPRVWKRGLRGFWKVHAGMLGQACTYCACNSGR